MNVGWSKDPLKAGDRKTFRKIYDQEMGYVWNCLRRLGVDDRDLEDKTHDVFVIFYRRFTDFDVSKPVRPWLVGIAARVALDHNRLAYKQRELLLDNIERSGHLKNPETELERIDRRRLVIDALDQLDLKQRTVFVLHDIEEHSIPEISQMIDVSENTLYSRLRLARSKFTHAVRRLQRTGGQR